MEEERFDIAVIGAGFGGIYAAYRFRQEGLSVIGIEGAAGVGGTWFHNGYPGSRVDTDTPEPGSSTREAAAHACRRSAGEVPISGTRAERYQVILHIEPATLSVDGEPGRSELEDGTRRFT